MRIAFFVNDLRTEKPGYATTHFAFAARRRGHETWHVGVEDFAYDTDDHLRAYGHAAPEGDYEDPGAFLDALRGEQARTECITVDSLDVLMLRNDPAEDAETRPWAQSVGLLFGEVARREGVLVLNDPAGLARAASKLYFQYLPAEIRPRTLITRHVEGIERLLEEHGRVVLKPLRGSGGRRVFVIDRGDGANFHQIVEAVAQSDYVIAQEYLPEAACGDVRLLMMNGEPLQRDGRYAAFRRIAQNGDLRSNVSVGGRVEPVEVDDRLLRIAGMVRPLLVEDGMFLVGLDVAGDKVMEVNVFSPGGIGNASRLQGVDFAEAIVEDVEHKVELRRRYGRRFDNRLFATM